MKNLIVLEDGSYADVNDVRIIEVNEEAYQLLEDGHPVENLEIDEFVVLKEYKEDWMEKIEQILIKDSNIKGVF
jgi:hypothetical protein